MTVKPAIHLLLVPVANNAKILPSSLQNVEIKLLSLQIINNVILLKILFAQANALTMSLIVEMN